MLPLFKKKHIHSRQIEKLLNTGYIDDYPEDANKRNALRQAALLYRMVDGEMFRYGTEREYEKYGLRLVVHDDQPEKKAEVISKCHVDPQGGHYGMNNTIKYVSDTYYWQGISAHVKMFCKKCELCKARSKFDAEEWLTLERSNIDRKKGKSAVVTEAQQELKSLGRVKKPTPPETFFIVNAERTASFEKDQDDVTVMIDSNNIEYVVETLGQSEGFELEEVCHVLNVPDIVPIPERFRSREIEQFLKHNTFPEDFTANMKCGLRGPASQYKMIDGELYHEGNKVGTKGMRLVVHDDMPALKVKVMVECHIDEDGSHHGLNRTLNRIGEKYFWSGMSLDVRKFMMHCKICNRQKGKKLMHDQKIYENEALKVKQRHMKKMNDNDEENQMHITYETAETSDPNGQQVIQLIGTYEDITEITLPMVNQETVTSQAGDAVSILQDGAKSSEYKVVCSSDGSGPTYVIKELTDAVAKIEAAEAAMELDKQGTLNEAEGGEASDHNVQTEMATENVETTPAENEDGKTNTLIIDTKNSVFLQASDGTQVEPGEDQRGNDDSDTPEVVKVLIIDGDENKSTYQNPMETVGRCVEIQKDDQHHYVQNATGTMSLYNGVIYVPKQKKTRIIEQFIKNGSTETSHSFLSRSTLKDLSENFEIVDDVLYRRPSRYKGRQAVVHDDNPELKLKLIASHHIKKNGLHCSETITCQNVSFKYYWEEQKWDVHRWYLTCKQCVDNGVDRRSQKKVLDVSERKKDIDERRRKNRSFGAKMKNASSQSLPSNFVKSIKINSVSRRRNEDLGEHNFAEPFKKKTDSIIELAHNVNQRTDGTKIKAIVIHSTDGSSDDVEIQIPETAENTDDPSTSIEPEEELQELLIYATLEQEKMVRDLFTNKGWTYDLESLTPAETVGGDNSESPELFMMTLKVTRAQEDAIKELFGGMGFEVGEQEFHQLDGSEVHTTEVEEQSHHDTVTIPELSDVTATTTSEEQGQSTGTVEIPVVKTDSQTQIVKTDSEPNSVKTAIEPPVVKADPATPVQRQTRKSMKGSESVKRPIEETQSLSTPMSESRRPRREIKRPRRFSPESETRNTPDSSPRKTTRTESVADTVSGKMTDKNSRSNVRRSEVSNDKTESTSKVDSQSFGKSRSGSAVVSKETVTNVSKSNATEKADDAKGKISVMSKARIRGKKVDKNDPETDDDDDDIGDDDDDDDYEMCDDDDDDNDNDDEFNPVMEELRAGGRETMEPIKMIDGYKCSLCDVKFLTEKQCKQHGEENTCYDNCGLCGKLYKKKDIESYMKHVNKHEKGEKLSCYACDKVFFDPEHLQIHDRLHKNVEVARCNICDEGFVTWFQYASHNVIKHDTCSLYTCDVCSAKFVKISFMKSELMFDGEMSYFKCVMCNSQMS